MSDDFPTAQTSRIRATGLANEAVRFAMGAVRRCIEDATARGQTDCTYEHRWGIGVADSVVQLLKDKGYQAGSDSDQREGSWVWVRW